MRNKKGFTLAELVTAVAILAMVAGFVSVIFKSSIDGYRSAGANTEIMQKLRAITEQLNSDFEGLCKDGYLIIRIEPKPPRRVYPNLPDEEEDFYMDRIYYFTTGDFQSWDRYEYEIDKFKYAKSNIARVFWGHDSNSLNNENIPLSRCRLARDIVLLTPAVVPSELPEDCRNVSFAKCKADIENLEDPNVTGGIMDVSVSVDFSTDLNNIRRLFCENIGEFEIKWSEGSLVLDPVTSTWLIKWLPDSPDDKTYDWNPDVPKPKAIKFTFTLYDSRGILDGGRRFSHIVYIGD